MGEGKGYELMMNLILAYFRVLRWNEFAFIFDDLLLFLFFIEWGGTEMAMRLGMISILNALNSLFYAHRESYCDTYNMRLHHPLPAMHQSLPITSIFHLRLLYLFILIWDISMTFSISIVFIYNVRYILYLN